MILGSMCVAVTIDRHRWCWSVLIPPKIFIRHSFHLFVRAKSKPVRREGDRPPCGSPEMSSWGDGRRRAQASPRTPIPRPPCTRPTTAARTFGPRVEPRIHQRRWWDCPTPTGVALSRGRAPSDRDHRPPTRQLPGEEEPSSRVDRSSGLVRCPHRHKFESSSFWKLVVRLLVLRSSDGMQRNGDLEKTWLLMKKYLTRSLSYCYPLDNAQTKIDSQNMQWKTLCWFQNYLIQASIFLHKYLTL